ncbi:MAG: Spy/CpxP family protein refolding chaperone [Candidatus Binatia bacterium]
MHTRILFVVVLLLFVSAAPVAGADTPVLSRVVHEELSQAWDELARQLHGLGNRWRDHFSGSEGRGERPLITFMLRHREELSLSPEQIRVLERLKNDFQREAIRREADLRIAETDLAHLLEAEAVELEQVETKIREIERLRADLRLARIRAIEEGKAQLTSEQRKKLQALLAEPRYTRLR